MLSPCLFNFYAENMWNARLGESQSGIKITGRNINNLRYADKDDGELSTSILWKVCSLEVLLKLAFKTV